MEDCFKLLHFHLGSQITNIRQVKNAVTEAARVYADLAKRGAGLKYLDVGGGLGVDYDGSQTNFESSMNYTLQEYANDVVYHIQTVCDEVGVPHPHIISESGRAVAAFHSVLVFGTLGVTNQATSPRFPAEIPEIYEQPLHDLIIHLPEPDRSQRARSYHDAQQALDMAMTLFSGGYLPLDQRVDRREPVLRRSAQDPQLLLDDGLRARGTGRTSTGCCRTPTSATSRCSSRLPDSWAIKQLFPVMPIHRLNEQPTRHAVIGDITCDSDGKIDAFIDRRDVKKTLLLHPYDGHHYYLGAFLIGAYQEILGDLHNLFGDTNAVHVDLSPSGEVSSNQILKGETVSEVLDYVQFEGKDLMARLQVVDRDSRP